MVIAPNTMFRAVLGVCVILNSFCGTVLLYFQAREFIRYHLNRRTGVTYVASGSTALRCYLQKVVTCNALLQHAKEARIDVQLIGLIKSRLKKVNY